MSKIEVDAIEPQSGTALTVGASGDTITVPSGAILTTTNATVNLPATTTVSTELKTNKISPASGTAFTLGDSGDTFTVPAGATITNSGTATGFGGITMAQQWRLSSNFTCNGNDQTITGWEAADQAGSVNIGSAMTESSGVFTFPQTGIYEITQTIVFGSSDYTDTNVSVVMQLSTNSGGAYTTQSLLWIGYESGAGNPPSRQTSNQSILMDVTDVSTDRFRTRGSNGDSTNAFFEGNTGYNATMLLFKRLGDT